MTILFDIIPLSSPWHNQCKKNYVKNNSFKINF